MCPTCAVARAQVKTQVLFDEVQAGGRIPLIIGRGLTTRARAALGLGATDAFRSLGGPPATPTPGPAGAGILLQQMGKGVVGLRRHWYTASRHAILCGCIVESQVVSIDGTSSSSTAFGRCFGREYDISTLRGYGARVRYVLDESQRDSKFDEHARAGACCGEGAEGGEELVHCRDGRARRLCSLRRGARGVQHVRSCSTASGSVRAGPSVSAIVATDECMDTRGSDVSALTERARPQEPAWSALPIISSHTSGAGVEAA